MAAHSYHIAQINVAKMIGTDIDDPIMKGFKDNIDRVNELAESDPNFVWRLKDEDTGDATAIEVMNDPQILINISVWKDIASLEQFTYRSFHSDFIKRKKEWFHKYVSAHYALWWIEAEQIPSIEMALAKLDLLSTQGPTAEAFTFKQRFDPPKP